MTFLSRSFFAALLLCVPANAQTNAPKAPGNLSFSGDLSYRAGGVRLDANARGPARVRLPQLDASARALALDLSGQTVTQVRALGKVSFKLDLAPRGGAGRGGAAAHIEATCDSATLTSSQRKLVLRGHLNGFYQVAGGAKNTLSGDGATIFYEGENLVADLTGGVSLRVAAESLSRPDALGDIVVSAQRARINQGDGSATFVGQARAVSSGGPNAFDVSAPRFTLTRGADGTLSTLKTVGRTLVKLDLPPDPASANATPTGANPGVNSIGKPTHVEVAADGATIERATSTAIFDGNVKGFYRLIQNAAPQSYNFAGTKAVIRYVPTPGAATPLAGFNLQVTGAEVEGPPFNLGF